MKRWMTTLRVLTVVLVVLAIAGVATACPMCKDTIAQAKNDLQHTDGAGVGRAFNTSIYTLLVGFFGALGLVTFNLVRAIRGK